MSRIVDRGAIFAGWVGLGMAVVVAMGFELIVAVQSLVFIFAPIGGLLIGFYADARSERRRPWQRVVANALYAGLFTAVSLAILYAGIRLIFVYGDSGYRDGTQGGPLVCTPGPQCTYERYLDSGRGPELAAAGVTDVTTFEQFVLQEQLNGALTIIALVTGGAIVGGLLYAAGRSRQPGAVRGTSGALATSASVRTDLDALFELGISTAQELLGKQQGEFYPFAVATAADGRPGLWGALPDGETPSPQEVVDFLVVGLRAQAAAGRIRATGVCLDARTVDPEGRSTDAIAVSLEHAAGDSVLRLLPYSLSPGDGLTLGTAFSAPGDRRIFTA